MRSQPQSWLALALALSSPAAADGPAPGFSSNPLPFSPPVFGVSATFDGGDVLTFDGEVMERVTVDGTRVQTYGTLASPVFASFAVIAPDESFAVVGESSTGVLYRIDLASGSVSPLTSLTSNYDAVIDASGSIYVSAGTMPGMNDLFRVDSTTGDVDHVAQVPGFSGPVDLDATGNLFLGIAQFPNRIVRYSPAQLAGGSLLSEADGVLVTTGWNGISYLLIDQETDNLFVVESDFVNFTDPPVVYRALSGKAFSEAVFVAPDSLFSFGKLELETDASHPAIFRAFQPELGGRLTVPVTDFGAFASERVSIQPRRPTAQVSGPGTGPGNSGPIEYTVEGAFPGGAILLGFGLASTLDPVESAYIIHPDVPPIFWGLNAGQHKFVQLRLAVDAGGKATFTVFNPGFYGAFIAFQSGLTDSNLEIVGSAPSVVL